MQPYRSSYGYLLGGATKVPLIFLILFNSLLQLFGLGLFNKLPTHEGMISVLYASEVLAALGVGITTALTILVTPHCIDAKDIDKFYFLT